jgi:hypothetical protein
LLCAKHTLVDPGAGFAGNASKDDQQRFIEFLGGEKPAFDIVIQPASVPGEVLSILANGGFTSVFLIAVGCVSNPVEDERAEQKQWQNQVAKSTALFKKS